MTRSLGKITRARRHKTAQQRVFARRRGDHPIRQDGPKLPGKPGALFHAIIHWRYRTSNDAGLQC
jgi:hypothetical protein